MTRWWPPDRDASDATLLMAGRTLGFAVAFVIPLVVVRVLDQASFGTYKYLFLIGTTMVVLQLGLAESLYYFVPKARLSAGRVVTNAVAMLAAIAGGLVLMAATGGSWLARVAGAPELAPHALPLSLFLAGLLVGMPLEVVMVARRRCGLAALAYAASDICRAVLLIGPAIALGTVGAILWGAVAFATLRVAATGVFLVSEFGIELGLDRALARAQLAYALPFAAAVAIEVAQVNLHQFVVWARFDPAVFAVYAAGCLQVPLVDLLATSVGNVLMVRMAEASASAAEHLALWHEAVVRLARVMFPLVLALWLTAGDLVVVLFTADYAGAVPIFRVAACTVLLAAFPVDSVLRAHADTRFLIAMNLLRVGIVIAGIGWSLAAFGLPGAMGITVAGLAAARAAAGWRIARLHHVGTARVLPWRALAWIALAATAAAIPAAWVMVRFDAPPLLRGATTTVVYGVVYIGLTVLARVFRGGQRAIRLERGPVRP